MPPKSKTLVKAESQPWNKISLEFGQFSDFYSELHKKSKLSKSFDEILNLHQHEEISVFQFNETNEQIVLGV